MINFHNSSIIYCFLLFIDIGLISIHNRIISDWAKEVIYYVQNLQNTKIRSTTECVSENASQNAKKTEVEFYTAVLFIVIYDQMVILTKITKKLKEISLIRLSLHTFSIVF